jgi:hypothetical protein
MVLRVWNSFVVDGPIAIFVPYNKNTNFQGVTATRRGSAQQLVIFSDTTSCFVTPNSALQRTNRDGE